MTKAKRNKDLKKITKQMNRTEEQNEMIKFVKILIIVVLIALGVYFLTRIFVTKDLFNEKNETKEVTFDYDKTIIGTLLNRPYDEYYVLIYSSNDLHANYYSNLVSSYKAKQGALKIYIADLDDSMNSKYYSKNTTNPKAKTIDDLKVGDLTLIKIQKKEIVKYIESVEAIKIELGL